MAEIHVERKRRSPWPWLLGAAALAVLVVLLVGVLDPETDAVDRAGIEPDAVTETETGLETGAIAADDDVVAGGDVLGLPAVSRFVEWAAGADATEFGLSHEHTANGIVGFSEALAAVAEQDTVAGQALEPALERSRSVAAAIQDDPAALTHADRVEDAFGTLTDLAAAIQQARFPAAEAGVAELRAAGDAIDPSTPLLDQADAVERYFTAAADLFGEMS